MRLEPRDIDQALVELLRVVRRIEGVEAELVESALAYFRGAPPTEIDDETRRATRRHLEWFLLERPNTILGGVPVEWALHRFGDLETEALTEDLLRALLSSRCSVFQVTGVAEGEGLWVRDLAALGEYPLSEPEGSHALDSDDIIVGRLFAVGDALYRVSPAAGVFRSIKLLRALSHDMESLRKARRGVLRLSQSEIEAMFWQRLDPIVGDPIAVARVFLTQAGIEHERIEAIFAELSQARFDPSIVVHGGEDILGAILVSLAFDTNVDLDAARRVLLEAWAALSRHRETDVRVTRAEDAKPKDVRTAIQAFDRGREAGGDLEALFHQLELDLDLEPEVIDPDAIDGAPAPDFPGVVGAMVEEFLWETEQTRGADAARECAVMRAFGEFGADYGVFENLGARELVLFASVWLAERQLLRSPDDARRFLRALREFCVWSQETQGVELLAAYETSLLPLETSLPRLVEANRWCVDGAGQSSEMFELTFVEPHRARLRDAAGNEFDANLDRRQLAALVVGDRLRGRRSNKTGCDVFRCYPAQSAAVAP